MQWEYKVIYEFQFTEIFNELGKEGWELVGILSAAGINNLHGCYFKRPLKAAHKEGEK